MYNIEWNSLSKYATYLRSFHGLTADDIFINNFILFILPNDK